MQPCPLHGAPPITILHKKVLETRGGLAHIPRNMNSLELVSRKRNLSQDRRTFLRSIGISSVLLSVPGAFAEELVRTPKQTEGPFYPDHLPLDTDNDLIIVNDGLTPAI